jgi:phage terminase large subunit GpA-like protein
VRYSSAITPYHREVMLALSDPETEYVVCKFPSQDGKTEILNNFIGWRIDTEPGPMLVLQPTKEMAEAWSKDRLAPMIRDTPALRGKVRDARSRDADNTILHKKFPGGHLTAVGSNSPRASPRARSATSASTRSIAARRAPAPRAIRSAWRSAARRRSGRGKKLLISSPTIKGDSRIDKPSTSSARRRSGTSPVRTAARAAVPRLGRHRDDVRPQVGAREAGDRALRLRERLRHRGASQGLDDRARASGSRRTRRRQAARSFWKNALTSNLVAWAKLVHEWLEVQGKPEQLQQFVNTVLCELWNPDRGRGEVDSLIRRQGKGYPKDNDRGTGTVPAGVAILTRSVDVQGDRLETCVWGWGANETSWLIEHELIPGDPSTIEPWGKLDEIMKRRYTHASTVKLRPRVTFIDSGGHHAKEVYNYCRTRQRFAVYAIKGSPLEGSPLLGRPSRPDSAKTILWHVGSFTGKESLIRRLTKILEPGLPGFIHLPAWLDSEQISQFTREKLVSQVQKGGKRKRVWQLLGRNEMMDLYVYALAALQSLGPRTLVNLGTIAKRLEASGAKNEPDPAAPADGDPPAAPTEEQPPAEKAEAEDRPRKKKRRRSRWVDGWSD